MSQYDSKSKQIDYELLQWLLERMEPQHVLFKLIKAELERRGHWKAKGRGKPFKTAQDERRNTDSLVGKRKAAKRPIRHLPRNGTI